MCYLRFFLYRVVLQDLPMLTTQEPAPRLYLDGPGDQLDQVSDALKFRPDNYWRADSYQIYKLSHGKSGWDGYLRPLRVRHGQVAAGGGARRGRLGPVLGARGMLGPPGGRSGPLPPPVSPPAPNDLPPHPI